MQRSKVVDEIYQYQGENLRPAHCRVRVYVGKDLAPVVIATECDDNPGASITTAADTLYPRIIAKYLPGWLDQAEELVLIEHYVGIGGEWGRRQRDSFDRVTFTDWRPRIKQLAVGKFVAFGEPEWQRLGDERVVGLVGGVE